DPPLVRHYILSKHMSPKRFLHVARSHWGIENRLHWTLDVQFAEDRNRARKDSAPENLAILRKLALNIHRTQPYRASLRRKIKRAGWDDAYLLATISHMRDPCPKPGGETWRREPLRHHRRICGWIVHTPRYSR